LEMLETTGAADSSIDQILMLSQISGTNREIIQQLGSLCAGNELAEQGREQLADVIDATEALGLTENNLEIDVSIARGLDYYTGTIVETFLTDLPSFGSICSGGRYDNLAQLYTKQQLPGIGASLGLDRLLAAMQQLDLLPKTKTTAEVMIVQFDKSKLKEYLKLAADLRSQGIAVELYPESKKLNQQFKYADRRGARAVIIAGTDEFASGVVQVKWLADGTQTELPLTENSTEIAEWLISRCTK
jgi:histidyl-tRNA synthetase